MTNRAAALLVLCMLAAWSSEGLAADEATEQEARLRYAQAFDPGLKAEERTGALTEVAKDYPETAWADDALWALAQFASRAGDRRRAILLRRQLLERQQEPKLERFTRRLPVYRESRIPQVLFVLDRTGARYSKKGRRVIPFNPVPMLACAELAADYQALGLHQAAWREYRRAMAAAPKDGILAKAYARRAERLKQRIELLNRREQQGKGETGQQSAHESDGQAAGGTAQSPGEQSDEQSVPNQNSEQDEEAD